MPTDHVKELFAEQRAMLAQLGQALQSSTNVSEMMINIIKDKLIERTFSWDRDLSEVPENEPVLIATELGGVGQATYDDTSGKWIWDAGLRLDVENAPIAWMPMPPPPHAEGGKE